MFYSGAAALFPGEHGRSLLRPFPFTAHRDPSVSSLSGEQPSRAAHPSGSKRSRSAADPSGDGETESGGSDFVHVSVMSDEVVKLFGTAATGTVIDATLGAGGHAEALLDAYDSIKVIGLDHDRHAIVAAKARLSRFGDRFVAHHARFDEVSNLVPSQSVDGVLFDLGVSSPQFDFPERGFSHRNSGPLDMRMDDRAELTAADVVNGYSERELTRILRDHADEPSASRIARGIIAARPMATTIELTEAVVGAVPAAVRRRRRHPAMRTFQAIRIEVNGELEILEPGLLAAIDVLRPAGRLAVLSYHSGEDRIVKQVMRDESRRSPLGRPDLPAPTGSIIRLRLLWSGAHKPSTVEIGFNSRATSAHLRAAERTEMGT